MSIDLQKSVKYFQLQLFGTIFCNSGVNIFCFSGKIVQILVVMRKINYRLFRFGFTFAIK